MKNFFNANSSLHYFIPLLFLMPSLAFCIPVIECKNLSFLKPSFMINNAEKCQLLLSKCPLQNGSPDPLCIKKTINANKICYQLNMLAKFIHASPFFIKLQAINNFILVDQKFIADNQDSYYLITPRNCLINTKVDPRNLNAELEKQYKNTAFVIMNWSKPEISITKEGVYQVSSTLKINKACLACGTVGFAEIHFYFSAQGKLSHVSLVRFSKNQ